MAQQMVDNEQDAYGIVLTAYGIAAVVAGLESLLKNESDYMGRDETKFISGLRDEIMEAYSSAKA